MDDEKVQLVDENNNIVGIAPRREALALGLWRRASGGILLAQDTKSILCHRRSLGKDERAGLWVATFGGKCGDSELPASTAKRELEEEFGISLDLHAFEFVEVYKSLVRRQFEYLHIAHIPFQIAPKPSEEVAEAKWTFIDKFLSSNDDDSEFYRYGYEKNLVGIALRSWN
jgi:isopentenyl-diphosphate Delta-isomerase